jgi:hypothetical protein
MKNFNLKSFFGIKHEKTKKEIEQENALKGDVSRALEDLPKDEITVDNETLEIGADGKLKVKDEGISEEKLSAELQAKLGGGDTEITMDSGFVSHGDSSKNMLLEIDELVFGCYFIGGYAKQQNLGVQRRDKGNEGDIYAETIQYSGYDNNANEVTTPKHKPLRFTVPFNASYGIYEFFNQGENLARFEINIVDIANGYKQYQAQVWQYYSKTEDKKRIFISFRKLSKE